MGIHWGDLRRKEEFNSDATYQKLVRLCNKTYRRLGYLPLLKNDRDKQAFVIHDISQKMPEIMSLYLYYLSTKLDTDAYEPYRQNMNIMYNTFREETGDILSHPTQFPMHYNSLLTTVHFLMSHIYNVLRSPSQPEILQTISGQTGIAPIPPGMVREVEKDYRENLLKLENLSKSNPPKPVESIGDEPEKHTDEEQDEVSPPTPQNQDRKYIDAIRGAGFISERSAATISDLAMVLALPPTRTEEIARRLVNRHRLKFKVSPENTEYYWVEPDDSGAKTDNEE